jgi:hypothetical protein
VERPGFIGESRARDHGGGGRETGHVAGGYAAYARDVDDGGVTDSPGRQKLRRRRRGRSLHRRSIREAGAPKFLTECKVAEGSRTTLGVPAGCVHVCVIIPAPNTGFPEGRSRRSPTRAEPNSYPPHHLNLRLPRHAAVGTSCRHNP